MYVASARTKYHEDCKAPLDGGGILQACGHGCRECDNWLEAEVKSGIRLE